MKKTGILAILFFATFASFLWAINTDGWTHWLAFGCMVILWAIAIRFSGSIGITLGHRLKDRRDRR